MRPTSVTALRPEGGGEAAARMPTRLAKWMALPPDEHEL